ncbi:macrophage immunometabolism regulator [Paramormyrops kingsleyae]|nr:UNC119-binding protein C5orf30 homolog [Paramormyrops kingsleyae]
MSLTMEMDVSGVSRTAMSVLPAPEAKATLKPEMEKPRCASTPCSPIKSTVSGYQIVHMNSNYLVGFTTGEELLKLAHKWSSDAENSGTDALRSPCTKPVDLGLHRASRIYKTKNRHYQPYDIPAVNGQRRRRMPSSGENYLKSLPGESGKVLHGSLPLCLLNGKRAHSKSLDYLNLDKMSVKEPADTEVLQYQLQHLTLRGERLFTRNKT